MYKTNLLLGLAMLLCPAGAMAEQLSLQQALERVQSDTQGAVVRRALSHHNRPNGSSHYQLATTAKTTTGDKNLYYVVNTLSPTGEEPQGFMILAADDVAPALLAYSNTPFVADSLPDNLRVWLKGYEASLKAAIAKGRPYQKSDDLGPAIPALVQTRWSQSGNYATLVQQNFNDAAFAAGAKYSYNTVTGCVATALAQVMNYHQYPAQGQGYHSYQFEEALPDYTAEGRDTTYNYTLSLAADFSQSHYDWANMAKAYDYVWNSDEDFEMIENTPAECEAVAQLMYDCGVAVEMDYGNGRSGAWTEKCAYALYNYFGYDKSVSIEYRNNYAQEDWERMIYNELANRRPVIYSGSSDESGHAFVCDGYASDGLFHINWGWAGSCDGYFSLWGDNALLPDEEMQGFNLYNDAICGIRPDAGGALTPDRLVMTDHFYLEAFDKECQHNVDINGRTLTGRPYVYVNDIANTSLRHIDCRIGLKFINESDPSVTYIAYKNVDSHLDVGDWTYAGIYTDFVAKAGTYRVYPIWADSEADLEDQKAWQEIKPIHGQTPQTITFSDDYKYSYKKYITEGLMPVRQDTTYSMEGVLAFEGLMYAIPDKSIEKARLGFKFVNVDDPSYVAVEPSVFSCHPKDMNPKHRYEFKATCMRIPQIGTYRIIPVWADWEANYFDPENWHDIEGFITDETTITFNSESLLRLVEEPTVAIRQTTVGQFPYINFKLAASQNNVKNVRIFVNLYRPKGENNKLESLGQQEKDLGNLSKDQVFTIKNMKISSSKLEKDYVYYYNIDYTVTDSYNRLRRGRLIPLGDNVFSLPDDVSGLETVNNADKEETTDGIYNLWGQKVTDTSLPGLYISEGKKLIISK